MAEWRPPQELDEYVVARPLGAGAMGEVYLAEDTLLRRPVALKFIAGEVHDANRDRFFTEARAIARLSHPNVVAIYRVGEIQRRPYLVSEFLRGVSLDKIERPMPWARALEIGVGLARGLAAAHRRGVLHRDIKPANAMLTDEGEVKLLDFGLARLTDDPTAPRSGEVLGSPLYMAPEAWVGAPPSRRVDIYALGTLLYELVAGRAPHAGIASADLPRITAERDAPPLAGAAPGPPPVDARFAAIVDRCLRRDPAERFDSGDALRDALEQLTAATAARVVPAGNPYRGLAPFEAEHRGLFFGRGREVREIVDRLRSEALVIVAGDSGVGKSSLCRAGVLPQLCDSALGEGRTWSTVAMVPGRRPLAALCAQLCFGGDEAAWATRLAEEPDALGRALRARPQAGTVLFIDQMEELLTLADREEAERLAEVLGALSVRAPGVRLLGTVRSDFLGRLAALPRLGDEVARALYLLRPLSTDGIHEAIQGPLAQKGYHFESPALVERLAAAAGRSDGGLPLLQFALAELWERRDEAKQQIAAAALERIGGVDGALARHADGVIGRLRPEGRAAARRILTRLVTGEGTRSRRTEAELVGPPDAASAREALEALVRGRLVTARESADGDGAYEIAHEALISGWDTLRDWLSSDAESRAARQRLEHAAREWLRLGRAREALLSGRALDEALAFDVTHWGALDREFVDQSRRQRRRVRLRRAGLLAAVPLLLGSALGVARYQSAAALGAQVASRLEIARRLLAVGSSDGEAVEQRRQAAFDRFDAGDWSAGEDALGDALARARALDLELTRAAALAEGAMALDPSRKDARRLFADLLLARLQRAELDHRPEAAAELAGRLSVYDDDGSRRQRLAQPASLAIAADPPATVELVPSSGPPRPLGATPTSAPELPAGTYVLSFSAPGRADTRLVVALARGERLPIAITLPKKAEVPAGYVHVPAGRFRFGSAEPESVRRGWLKAAPEHTVTTGAYLIARTEVTFGEWIAWLDTLSPAEQAARRPRAKTARSTVELARAGDGRWQLHLRPTVETFSAMQGEPLRMPMRNRRSTQDWSRLPVSGVSIDDAEAYAAWLSASGRVPQARLCTEHEWERAARGADGRLYPSGDEPGPDDFNRDVTYGREPLSFGPDEAGSHPVSRSLYGVDDLAGNVWEWARSVAHAGEIVHRGGSWYQGDLTAKSTNREISDRSLRHPFHGVRLCATPQKLE